MTIPVTTRSGKGSALTFNDGDTNLDNLARDATDTQQGNIEIATQAEHTALSSTTQACVPGRITTPVNNLIDAKITANFTASLVANGFWKENDTGLTIQWMRFTGVPNAGATFNFPTPFGTACFSIVASWDTDTVTSDNDSIGVTIVSASQFKIDRNSQSNQANGYMIAVGH